ncbi:MAG: ABC transporter permease [Victivallales bacterium]|nr:ABC transporter permease [Victivallales bacterium]MBR6073754.1 ABC transporter permease [Victivallales bacterium]MBR6324075.1 ABC transporter permease [Victivallales bacterium]
MLAYIIRRLLYVVPTLLGVNILVFVLFFMVNTPDDMARQALGEKNMDPLQVERWKEAHGYEVPLFWNGEAKGAQCLTKTIFFRKSLAMLWGNFGHSDMTQESIGGEIRRRALPSLCVSTPIFLATLLINIILAMIVATKRGSVSDVVTQFLCVALMSISGLIYIIAGQYFFAKLLRWTPVSGFLQGMDMWKFLVLPILVGTVSGIGGGVRLYRTLFLEEINRDYVRTARAKGLPESQILFLHVLKNAMIPILTNVPLQLLTLMMGNMLLENFFSIPGLGGYTITALGAQDFAIVRAMVFLGSVLYIIGLLLADICYSIVDPRIRLG